MECEIKAIFHHVDGNHKQTCSNLERAGQLITEALQYEFRQNTTLRMLIHRLEERAAENGRSLSEQVASNRQLKLQVDELQKQLEDKDNSLTQAKKSIAMLKNELRDLRQQLHSQENSERTIQEVTEWLQDGENQPNDLEEEGSVLPNPFVEIKEEVADDGYPCSQSVDDTDTSTEHTNFSSADIKAEMVKEEGEMFDIAPVGSPEMSQSPPDPGRYLRLSVQLVDCGATQDQQATTSNNNEDGERLNTVQSQPVPSNATVCHCGQDAVLLTVLLNKEEPNQDRQFYKCNSANCDYFLWADEQGQGLPGGAGRGNNPQPSPRPSLEFGNTSQGFRNGGGVGGGPGVGVGGGGGGGGGGSEVGVGAGAGGGEGGGGGDGDGGQTMCNCNELAVSKTVMEDGPSKGRMFHTCAKPSEEQCGFFQWADEDVVPPASRGLNSGEPGRRGRKTTGASVCNCDELAVSKTVVKVGSSTGRKRGRKAGKTEPPSSSLAKAAPAAKRYRTCGVCNQPGHTRTTCPHTR